MTFAYLKSFLGLKCTAGPDRSKVFNPLNIDFAFKTLRKLAIFGYDGFGLEAPNEEEEECMKPRKQAPTRQLFKKGRVCISTRGALHLEKVFCSLRLRTFTDKASECHSVPVL